MIIMKRNRYWLKNKVKLKTLMKNKFEWIRQWIWKKRIRIKKFKTELRLENYLSIDKEDFIEKKEKKKKKKQKKKNKS